MSKELYLIALIPHEELRNDVRKLKLEMKERFNASHALKSPAHITLQMPFRRDEANEDALAAALETFAKKHQAFDIRISGFDAFPPRVLFLSIEDHKPVANLHADLQILLKDTLNFPEKELMSRFHPHITIATRDLSKKMFHKAWPEFKEREFEGAFTANSLHLLKHNGKNWDMYREFGFGG
ncbi:2'-5' RNA ligase family protein [Rhodohalobacter sp. 8-1]|uniref:2'-5' RNA ligase family protein n=1 Tax=Rhodohalobacter sp. 8-1 TaxID=3131972 RepID=UPI0030EE5AEB